MIQTKYTFITEEAKLSLPLQGEKNYILENSFPINYSRNIIGSCKREVSLKTNSNEDQPYIRFVYIKVKNIHLKFSDGSYAMQDILKKITSIYNKLNLRVSYIGKIMAIDNISELQEIWKDTKEYIESKYRGKQVQQLIDKTNEILNSEKTLIEEISLYQNFGALLKPLYHQYNTSQSQSSSQGLNTRYGKIVAKEEVSLQPSRDTKKIELKINANYPENEEYLNVDGTYNFMNQTNAWLHNATIHIIEKYGRQEYKSKITVIQI
ncbi:hypothetical protein [Aquimarina sp. MMG016]|uniref:hypothetical protein n=1 Tax=Aquimarina sp. MMG016 TaxID=2822690 RepID=UPI001B3A727B|nr:hypothetical protein [Aquimarina sp. MMG016]MBQ4822423.1 hypothetical protein [Aquimarina sp. MMG016]